MIPVLHSFQNDLVGRIRGRVAAGYRIIVVQASTGAGKTVLASAIVKQASLKGSETLWMVHRRRLVDQASNKLVDFQVDHGILMRGEKPDRYAIVQVASRDTLLSRCVRNQWLGLPLAKLIVVDECHHAADPQSEYRRILANYPGAIILLLTATPCGPDGSGLGPWAQAIECAAPTSQLVRDGFLMPVRCYAPDRKRRGNKYVRGLAGDLVSSWENFGEGRPTALFCSRVQHSLDAVEAFTAAGISAAHVDADTTDDERDRIFDEVAAGRIKILSNVAIIGEGVDIPELACCQIFCECGSRVGFLQKVGRIMRPWEDKKYGILIDHAGACFRHGFPDEDTEWTLEGNADEAFAKKHAAGQTEKAHYCKHCALIYHGDLACPKCGRQPVKPPRSIFAPPPQDSTNEILTEADREQKEVFTADAKEKHWMTCISVAFRKGGSFGMAAQIYKRKYKEWPKEEFPCIPERYNWRAKVSDIYPNFGSRRTQ